MKLIVLTTHLLFILFFMNEYVLSQSTSIPNSTKGLGIMGNVVSLIEREISVKGTRNNLIRTNINVETEYSINAEEVKIISHRDKGIQTNYTYNFKNKLIEINSFYIKDKSPAGRTLDFYDDDGNLILEKIYSKSGRMQDSVIYTNINTNSVIKAHYNIRGDVFKTEEIKKDLYGNEIDNFQIINGTSTRIICKYDTNTARMLEEFWYLDNQLVQQIFYDYNEKGHLVAKIECDEKGKRCAVSYFEYDIISGLVTSIHTINHSTSFEYNFDNAGNWITKYEFYDDYPVKIIEREIKYSNTR